MPRVNCSCRPQLVMCGHHDMHVNIMVAYAFEEDVSYVKPVLQNTSVVSVQGHV